MSVKNYTVSLCNRNEIKEFIETYHYSKNINGISSPYCFKLLDNGDMIGAMVYGYIAMQGVWKKYAEKETDLIELRRLCCVDDTPKNAESFLIGRSLRKLTKDWGGKIVVSYADAEYGHSGTIYKASNFKYLGHKKGARIIVHGDKKYHDKAIRT